jgi:hypothetical protein
MSEAVVNISVASFVSALLIGLVLVCYHEARPTLFRALAWKMKGNSVTTAAADKIINNLYSDLRYGTTSPDDFRKKILKTIEANQEIIVGEPRTALGHLGGWARRTGTILGAAGAVAVLGIGDVLAWQNLNWIGGIGASIVVAGTIAGTVWTIVDEYHERY